MGCNAFVFRFIHARHSIDSSKNLWIQESQNTNLSISCELILYSAACSAYCSVSQEAKFPAKSEGRSETVPR